jgi:hypothetical protein
LSRRTVLLVFYVLFEVGLTDAPLHRLDLTEDIMVPDIPGLLDTDTPAAVMQRGGVVKAVLTGELPVKCV